MPVREDGSYVSDREVRERSCRFKECLCTHTDCYDGWVDSPSIPDGPAVRCERCAEAADMAATLAAERKGSKRRGR